MNSNAGFLLFSVPDTCNLPFAFDLGKIKTRRRLYDFPVLAAPEHLHVLLDIRLNINDVLGIADEFLYLLILDVDLAVLCIPFTRRVSLDILQGLGILGEILIESIISCIL